MRVANLVVGVSGLLGVFGLVATIYWSFTKPINPDEIEHLHATYLLLQGDIPYVDFWQNHTPMLWFSFAPVMALLPAAASICYAARAFSLAQAVVAFLIALAVAFRLAEPRGTAKASGQRPARRLWIVSILAAVYWGTAVVVEAPLLRPDGAMKLCMLLAALASIRADAGQRASILATGFFVGLGFCFSPKLAPIALAFPIATMLSRGFSLESVRVGLVYLGGGVLGVLPLAAYLLATHSAQEFYHWVIDFNASSAAGARPDYETVSLPILVAVLALSAIVTLGRPGQWRQAHGSTIRWMFALSVLFAIVFFPLRISMFTYYLAPALTLAAICVGAGAGELTVGLRRPVLSGILGFGILAAVFVPTEALLRGQFGRDSGLPQNVERLQWMIDQSMNGTVQCTTPFHPIYARDLTPFYVAWQFHFARQSTRRSEMLWEYLRGFEDYAVVLQRERPELLRVSSFSSYLHLLAGTEMMDGEGVKRLHAWIASNYDTVDDAFYVLRPEPGEG